MGLSAVAQELPNSGSLQVKVSTRGTPLDRCLCMDWGCDFYWFSKSNLLGKNVESKSQYCNPNNLEQKATNTVRKRSIFCFVMMAWPPCLAPRPSGPHACHGCRSSALAPQGQLLHTSKDQMNHWQEQNVVFDQNHFKIIQTYNFGCWIILKLTGFALAQGTRSSHV